MFRRVDRFLFGTEENRSASRWRLSQPASDKIFAIEIASILGKWLMRVHGAGLVASIALMIAAYTSITGHGDRICVAAQFVSVAFSGGRTFAWLSTFGGAVAMVVASMPEIVGILRRWTGRRRISQTRIQKGQELQGLTERYAGRALLCQIVLVVMSVACAGLNLVSVIHPGFFASADIVQAWSDMEAKCPLPSSALRFQLPIYGNVGDWPRP